jgi:hypothetical protein
MVEGRSHNSHVHHPKGAAKGFSVSSMGSTLTTTLITTLRRSRRIWSGKLRRKRRQRAWL